MKEILILSTTGSVELAETIARALVESKLAACVNILPGVRSIYRWQDRLCDDAECLLFIKSAEKNFEAVRTRIRELHNYEVPEVIALSITSGDSAYLEWLRRQTV